MNSRERVIAAIRHNVPDRIPVDAIAIENCDAVALLLGIPEVLVIDRLGIDGQSLGAYQYTGEMPVRDGKTLSPWGIEDGNDYGTSHFYPLASASVSEVERYAWHDATRFDFDNMHASLRERTGEYALRGPYWVSGPLFCTTTNLMGMEAALLKMLVEPEVFEAYVEQMFRFSEAYLHRFIATTGSQLDILYLADDFGSQRGMLMDPVLWRRFLKPRHERLFAIGKKLGIPVWFHSCGDITPVLPDLIDIGVDVWETVQLHTLP